MELSRFLEHAFILYWLKQWIPNKLVIDHDPMFSKEPHLTMVYSFSGCLWGLRLEPLDHQQIPHCLTLPKPTKRNTICEIMWSRNCENMLIWSKLHLNHAKVTKQIKFWNKLWTMQKQQNLICVFVKHDLQNFFCETSQFRKVHCKLNRAFR